MLETHETEQNYKQDVCIILTEKLPGFLSRWTNWKPGRYEVTAVWYSVQHPAGPPLVIVRTEEQETQQ